MEDFMLLENLEVDLGFFDFDRVERDGTELISIVSDSLSEDEVKPVKSRTLSNLKAGAKFERRKTKATVKHHKLSVYSVFQMIPEPDFGLSQRRSVHSLYRLPHVNNCDSLLFFPGAYSKLSNSGDISSLSTLILTHFDENCCINYQFLSSSMLSPRNLIQLLEVVSELRPDGILRVRSAEVTSSNQIEASMVMRCTDSKVLFDALASSTRDRSLVPRFLQMRREDDLKQRIVRNALWSQEQKQRLVAMVESGVDLVKEVDVKMVLTVNPVTSMVVEVTIMGRITSLEAVVPDEVL